MTLSHWPRRHQGYASDELFTVRFSRARQNMRARVIRQYDKGDGPGVKLTLELHQRA